MKITIDTEVIERYGLSIVDFLTLFSVRRCAVTDCSLQKSLNFLKDNGFILNDMIASEEGMNLIDEIIDKSSEEKERDIEGLASKLQALWPAGNKDGKYRWKSNKTDVIKRINKFFRDYGNKYSDEDILNAAKKYVHKFDVTGNRTYQKLLKYFIFKEDGSGSLLADYLESMGEKEELQLESYEGESLF